MNLKKKNKSLVELRAENRYLKQRLKRVQAVSDHWSNRYTNTLFNAIKIGEELNDWICCAEDLAWSGTGNKKLKRGEAWETAHGRFMELKSMIGKR